MNQTDLLRTFEYDPDTGVLRWKERPIEDFVDQRSMESVNTRMAGKVAGLKHYQASGRPHALQVKLNQRPLTAHRIAWTMVHGDIPTGYQIDHANGDPFDNRLANLRLALPSHNCQNRRTPSSNTTGLKGVSKSPYGFKATITVRRQAKHLGYHPTKGLAAVAYAKAAIRYHGEFARIK